MRYYLKLIAMVEILSIVRVGYALVCNVRKHDRFIRLNRGDKRFYTGASTPLTLTVPCMIISTDPPAVPSLQQQERSSAQQVDDQAMHGTTNEPPPPQVFDDPPDLPPRQVYLIICRPKCLNAKIWYSYFAAISNADDQESTTRQGRSGSL